MFKLYVILFALLRFAIAQEQDKVITFDPSSLTLEKGSNRNISIRFVSNPTFNRSILVNFTYGDENNVYNDTNLIKWLEPVKFEAFENNSKSIKLETIDVGHLVIGVQSNDIKIPMSNVFRLAIIHSNILDILSDVIGWTYFFAWSISFYPQVFLNFKIKDVTGLSFDFISLNFLGHSCYAVFNIALYFFNPVQKEYFKDHPRGVNPVQLNDVFFSCHAVLLTFITIIQCIYYRKPGKMVSKPAMGLLVIMITFLVISGIVCLTTSLSILNYIYFFSYIKLAITIMKYIPQAWTNFKRKSTVGWSILNVLLDFTGGSLSLLQMFFLAYNYNDWTSIFGSPTKLGLGLLSILFDVIFMVQHYCLYYNKRQEEIDESNSYEPISS